MLDVFSGVCTKSGGAVRYSCRVRLYSRRVATIGGVVRRSATPDGLLNDYIHEQGMNSGEGGGGGSLLLAL